MKNFLITFVGAVCALVVVIFGYQKIQEKQVQGYVNAAHIAQGLATSSRAKIVVLEYWSQNGKLPCTSAEFEEFGISMPEPFDNPVLPRLELTGCGQLTLTFQVNSGIDGGKIVLQAREAQDAFGMSVDWTCSTNDYVDIAKYIPQCAFSDGTTTDPIGEPETTGSRSDELSGDGAGESASADRPIQSCDSHALLHRSVFADSVENRIPQHRIAVIGPQRDTIYFFTEVIGAGGGEVTHEWFHDDVAVAAVPFDIKADRWRTWSSKRLEYMGPGMLRVDVRDGECLIGQESIKISDQEIEDPAALAGWMTPRQAVEKTLADQADETAGNAERQEYVDDLVDGGDTLLLAAIRRGNAPRALSLIRKGDSLILKSYPDITHEELQRHIMMANPFLRDADGVSPIELAHQLGQGEVVEALIESATMLDTHGRGRRGNTRHGRWDDQILRITKQSELTRFEDGDTPLIRAVRTRNGRAVVTLLALATWNREKPYPATELLYAYDAGGRQALDIARDADYYGIERFLQLAIDGGSPKWAVSRSTLTTQMVDDEPAQCRQAAFDDETKLIFFAEITDMTGEKISHEWEFDGQTVQSNSFDIKSQRWTTQSSRAFSPGDVGSWRVKVTTAHGEVLRTEYLTYHALTPYLERNRNNYNPSSCEMGSAALYAFVKAHAPVARIQYLIDKGLSLESDTKRSRDLLYQAVSDGNITLTRWFLDRGFDINAYLDNASTALLTAVGRGDEAMVLYLLNRGADMDKQRVFGGGRYPLQVAAHNNYPGVTRILLENGADPNSQDGLGTTALISAAYACGLETTRALLEYGADPAITDEKNRDPAYWGARCVSSKKWPEDTPELALLSAASSSVNVM